MWKGMGESSSDHLLNQLKQGARRRSENASSSSWRIEKMHCDVIKKGVMGFKNVPNMLIKGYSNSNLIHQAFKVFTRMGKRRDVISWSTILSSLNQASAPQKSIAIFPLMFSLDSLLPDPFILSTLLHSCSLLPSSLLPLGRQLHALSILSPSLSDPVVHSSLLHMYSKCSHPSYASFVFLSLPTHTTPSFTSLLHAFAASGYPYHAFHLFKLIPNKNAYSLSALISGLVRSRRFKPAVEFFGWSVAEGGCVSSLVDSHVLSSVIAASSGCVSLVFGRIIHCVCVRSGFGGSVFVGNALVDMYSKCGDVWGARVVFEGMVYRDVVSWSTVIVGLARHGEAGEAISVYGCMVEEGLEPNEVTFVGLMYACSHAGLVEEGRRFFFSMVGEFGIRPSLWHYTCFVDLLCRNGYIEEAEGVIRGMPFEPDDAVWACVLSACRRHGDGEGAARMEELFLRWSEKSGGFCGSGYLLLSNIYAQAALWDKVVKARVFMTGMKLEKTHGCSSNLE